MLLKEVNSFCLFFNRIRQLMLYLLLICDYFHSLMKQTSGGGWWVSHRHQRCLFSANTCKKKRILAFFPAIAWRCQQEAANIDHLFLQEAFRNKLWSISFVFTLSLLVTTIWLCVCFVTFRLHKIKYIQSKKSSLCPVSKHTPCGAALCLCRCRSQPGHTSCRNAAARQWCMCCMASLLQKVGSEELLSWSSLVLVLLGLLNHDVSGSLCKYKTCLGFMLSKQRK